MSGSDLEYMEPILYSCEKFWGTDYFISLENVPNLRSGKKCIEEK